MDDTVKMSTENAHRPGNTPESGGGKPGASRRRLRRLALASLATVLALAAAVYAVHWVVFSRFHESTDDAYVAGNQVALMPQVAGTVTAILADDTQQVRQGQTVVTLSEADAKLALEQAEAGLADAVRQVRQLFQNAAQQKANVNVRKAELKKAQEDLDRRQALIGKRLVSAEEVQHARTALETAQAALVLAEHQSTAADVLVENTTLEHHPMVEQAKAKVRDAYLALVRTYIPAPVSGYVAKRSVQVGQHVTPGTPLMAIVPLQGVWVDANFKEGQLSDVRIGQPANLTSDLYGGDVVYHGKVLGLSAGTGSAFSLLPPQNATGNWIKVVQRVPVRIALDAQELARHPLRIGLSMNVEIDTHDKSGPVLAQGATPEPVYATPVFDAQAAPAEAVIRAIIAANGGGQAAENGLAAAAYPPANRYGAQRLVR